MRQITAFLGKEMLQLHRSGRLWILLLLFILFGISSPAMARLTPWLFETMADSFAEIGLIYVGTEVTSLTSWAQFYKNAPVMLLIFLLMFSGIITAETEKDTVTLMLAKGLSRTGFLASKAAVVLGMWTLLFSLCFFITWGYTAWFWDNSLAAHWFAAGVCQWLFGVWLCCLLLLFSGFMESGSGVLLLTGAVFVICYIASVFKALQSFTPVRLMSASGMLQGTGEPSDYTAVICVTVCWCIASLALAAFSFSRRRI
ncbi:MAG: ABC transporter permease [Emergencia sp.]